MLTTYNWLTWSIILKTNSIVYTVIVLALLKIQDVITIIDISNKQSVTRKQTGT